MPPRFKPSPIREIRFTRHAVERCSAGERSLADRVVCEAIATGAERPLGHMGASRRRVSRFEKTFRFRDRRRPRRATVFVLCENLDGVWIALTAYAVRRRARA